MCNSITLDKVCMDCGQEVWLEDGDWQCECWRVSDYELRIDAAEIPVSWKELEDE